MTKMASQAAAVRIASLSRWSETAIRDELRETKTDLFKRNTGIHKADVCHALAEKIWQRYPTRPTAQSSDRKCTALFFAANPAATTQLNLAEEAREITEKIRKSKYRETIELISAWATRPDDLLQYLNQHKATIVHFSGHDSGPGGLILQDDQGNAAAVTAPALKSLFQLFRQHVRLVILNACDSIDQAKAIAGEIDCVIGMQAPIGDEAARVFAASLYRAIGFGVSISDAFKQGKTALLLQGIPEASTPKLICKPGINPKKIHLVFG